jgi:hypothetical protein
MDDGIVVVLLGNTVKRWIKHERLSLTFTRAPMTPSEVSRRYSKGRVFDVVFRKGYRNKGMWASARSNVVGMTKSCVHTIQEQLPCLRMRSYTLQKGKSIANPVRYMRS